MPEICDRPSRSALFGNKKSGRNRRAARLENHSGIYDLDIGIRVNGGRHPQNPHESLFEVEEMTIARAVLGLERRPCDELWGAEDVEAVGELDIAIYGGGIVGEGTNCRFFEWDRVLFQRVVKSLAQFCGFER